MMIALLLLAISISGCTSKEEPAVEETGPSLSEGETQKATVEEPQETIMESEEEQTAKKVDTDIEEPPIPESDRKSDLVLTFEQLVSEESTEADIVRFIENNIDAASPREAEYMMAYLIVFQTEYIEIGNEVLHLSEYMNALNVDMGGILAAEKINFIEDETIRGFYQTLDNSYLTIVRYEETPVVEFDWNKVADLGLLFSEGFNYVVKERSYLRDIDYEDYYGVAESIAEVERLLNKADSKFEKNQLQQLYTLWISYLVIGPEGSFMDYYITKEGSVVSDMKDFAEDYPESKFGQFIHELVITEYANFFEVSEAYDRYIGTLDDGDTQVEELRLDAYLNMSAEEALTVVNELSGVTFIQLPEVEKTTTGIFLRGKIDETAKLGYGAISYKRLLPYVELVPYDHFSIGKMSEQATHFERTLIQLLLSDMTTEEYVRYMVETIDDVTIGEAEKMIEVLMLFQTETIERSAEIEDEDLETFYETIDKSLLRVAYDEDIRYLEMDWSSLESLDIVMSESLAYIIEARTQMDANSDYYRLARETIRLEVMEDKVTSPFVKGQMELLYDEWVGVLLAGEVGNHYDAYVMKSGELYEEMERFATAYPGSALGGFVQTLVDHEDLTYKQVTTMVDAFMLSENLGNKKWTMTEIVNESTDIQKFVFMQIGNSEITDKINKTVDQLIINLIDSVIKGEATVGQSYKIDMLPLYSSESHVTLYMSIAYNLTETDTLYGTEVISIDLASGEVLTPGQFLAVDNTEALKIINDLADADFTLQPSIALTSTGVILIADPAETARTQNASISKRALFPYVEY